MTWQVVTAAAKPAVVEVQKPGPSAAARCRSLRRARLRSADAPDGKADPHHRRRRVHRDDARDAGSSTRTRSSRSTTSIATRSPAPTSPTTRTSASSQGDVLDLDRLTELAAGCTHFVHAAGIAGVDTVLTSPVRTMRVNVIGTYNALEAASATRETVERFVEFSTSEVFGQHAFNVQEGHVTTIGSVGEARWTYAVSKLAGEHMAHAYHAELGLPAVSVRPFNIFGPGQIGGGAIRAFIEAALAGRDLEIHGDGSQIRAWCYVDDMVEAVLLGARAPDRRRGELQRRQRALGRDDLRPRARASSA